MNVRSFLIVCCGLGAFASTAFADPFENARNATREGKYEKALASLDSAIASNPEDFEFLLLKARIHAWQGKYPLAERELSALSARYPGDDEVRFAQAYLLYYEGHFEPAQTEFEALLKDDPGNTDIVEGLEAVRRARTQSSKRWHLAAGGEYSVFTRRDQPGWGDAFVQLGRALDSRTEVYVRGEYWRQFELNDAGLEAGVSHRFSENVYATMGAGWTPDADFKPDWRVMGEAGLRAWHLAGSDVGAWLLAGAWYDSYESTEILRTSPGVRLEYGPAWAVTGRAVRIDESHRDALYGWNARVDGPVPALKGLTPGWKFYAGLGDAPETVVFGTGAVTVATFTLFAGAIVPLGTDLTLDLGYSRDDRENAYIRHAFHAVFSQRF